MILLFSKQVHRKSTWESVIPDLGVLEVLGVLGALGDLGDFNEWPGSLFKGVVLNSEVFFSTLEPMVIEIERVVVHVNTRFEMRLIDEEMREEKTRLSRVNDFPDEIISRNRKER